MNKFRFGVLTLLISLLSIVVEAQSKHSCSTFMITKGDSVVIGHNLDEYIEVPGMVVINKRNIPVDCYSLASKLIKNFLESTGGMNKKSMSVTYGFNPKLSVQNHDLIKGKLVAKSCICDSLYKQSWDKYLSKYEVLQGGMDFKWYAKLAFAMAAKSQSPSLDQVINEGLTFVSI